MDHLKAAGFPVKVHETPDTGPFASATASLTSSAVAIRAWLPAMPSRAMFQPEEVKRLLAQKPAAAGLSVPGMPVGSPGMEVGSRKDPFQVLLIDKAGRSKRVRKLSPRLRRFT